MGILLQLTRTDGRLNIQLSSDAEDHLPVAGQYADFLNLMDDLYCSQKSWQRISGPDVGLSDDFTLAYRYRWDGTAYRPDSPDSKLYSDPDGRYDTLYGRLVAGELYFDEVEPDR